MWLSVGGSAGHGGLWALTIIEGTPDTPGGRVWQTTVEDPTLAIDAAEEAKTTKKRETDAVKLADAERALCNTMAKLSKPEGKNTIRELAPLGHGTLFARAWASLIEQGAIVQNGTISKGNLTPDAYTLSDGSNDDTPTTGSPW